MSVTDIVARPVLRARWVVLTDARGHQRAELRWSTSTEPATSTPTEPATSELAGALA